MRTNCPLGSSDDPLKNDTRTSVPILKEGESMKELYTKAELEVFKFAETDIIATSGNTSLDPDEVPPIIIG
jgi:hypothetical protein